MASTNVVVPPPVPEDPELLPEILRLLSHFGPHGCSSDALFRYIRSQSALFGLKVWSSQHILTCLAAYSNKRPVKPIVRITFHATTEREAAGGGGVETVLTPTAARVHYVTRAHFLAAFEDERVETTVTVSLLPAEYIDAAFLANHDPGTADPSGSLAPPPPPPPPALASPHPSLLAAQQPAPVATPTSSSSSDAPPSSAASSAASAARPTANDVVVPVPVHCGTLVAARRRLSATISLAGGKVNFHAFAIRVVKTAPLLGPVTTFVLRRFSEFEALRATLVEALPQVYTQFF